MSRLINLMPESYRLRLGDHRLRGRYGMLYVGVLSIAFVLGLTGHAGIRDRERRVAALDEEAARLADIVERTKSINLEADKAQNEIAESQRLELTAPVTGVLATISSLMPEHAQLSELRLWVYEQAELPAGARRAHVLTVDDDKARNPFANLDRTLKGEMTGIAMSGVEVSGFFDRLYQHPLFARVQTDFSRIKVVKDVEVHEFRISFDVDLDVRYDNIALAGEDERP